ncbi:unnamed protein product, partial [Hymenolepis diminuta]
FDFQNPANDKIIKIDCPNVIVDFKSGQIFYQNEYDLSVYNMETQGKSYFRREGKEPQKKIVNFTKNDKYLFSLTKCNTMQIWDQKKSELIQETEPLKLMDVKCCKMVFIDSSQHLCCVLIEKKALKRPYALSDYFECRMFSISVREEICDIIAKFLSEERLYA